MLSLPSELRSLPRKVVVGINYYSHVVEFCETKKEGFVSSSFYDLSLVTCVINVSVLIFLFS